MPAVSRELYPLDTAGRIAEERERCRDETRIMSACETPQGKAGEAVLRALRCVSTAEHELTGPDLDDALSLGMSDTEEVAYWLLRHVYDDLAHIAQLLGATPPRNGHEWEANSDAPPF